MATIGTECGNKGGFLETVFSLLGGVMILTLLVFLYGIKFVGFEFIMCVLITIVLIENIRLSLRVDRLSKRFFDSEDKNE